MKNILLASLLILLLFLVSGCNQNNTQEVVCSHPYTKVGNSCCLDQNVNFMCDTDEIEDFEVFPNPLRISTNKDTELRSQITIKNTGNTDLEGVRVELPQKNNYPSNYPTIASFGFDGVSGTELKPSESDSYSINVLTYGTPAGQYELTGNVYSNKKVKEFTIKVIVTD